MAIKAFSIMAVVAALATLAAAAASQTVILYPRSLAVDAGQIASIARIYEPVMIDSSIRPGDPWRRVIGAAIRDARTVIVLWDARAAASIEVQAEVRQALAGTARIVPILLDDTPLGLLSEHNGITWQQVCLKANDGAAP